MYASTLLNACIAVIVTLAIAGCGSNPSSTASQPAETVMASQRAAQHYTSVHASGLLPESGGRTRLDLRIVPDKGAVGYINYPPYALNAIRIGQSIYLKSEGLNFYELIAGSKAAIHLRRRWVRASIDTAGLIHALSALTELRNLTDTFFGRPGKLSMGGMTFVAGTKVTVVRNDTTGESLFVAAAGDPYPFQIVEGGASSATRILLDQWNDPVPIGAPPKAIDIEKLNEKA